MESVIHKCSSIIIAKDQT